MTTLAYLGNFQPDLPEGVEPWSTEHHIALSLEEIGCEVVRIQEGDTPALEVPDRAAGCDLLFHTQTYGLALSSGTLEDRQEASRRLSQAMPRVFLHLDLFHGLERSQSLPGQPWLEYEHVLTADGGHDAEWKALGVNHHWMPPAVYGGECYMLDVPRTIDVLFVGSWQGGYHPESTHRHQLVRWLQRTYRQRARFYPRPGRTAVRGHALNRLYASAKVTVGDSCLVPELRAYWSDRIAETTGRSGFLLHPAVEGLAEQHPYLNTWEAGNWDELRALIDHFIADADEREAQRVVNHEHTRRFHTYAHRMQDVLSIVNA